MPFTYIPNTVDQISEFPDEEISWDSTRGSVAGCLLGARWSTVKPLHHYSNPACGDLRTRSWALVCTNFQMAQLPDVITGLELNVKTQRNGRIVDEQIQLTYNGSAIGSNNFNYITDSDGHLRLLNDTAYGSPTDTWAAELTPEMLQDPSFGVILKFQGHPYYPHLSSMSVDSVSLTVY